MKKNLILVLIPLFTCIASLSFSQHDHQQHNSSGKDMQNDTSVVPKVFFEYSIGAGITRVNTIYTHFETRLSTFDFIKNHYNPDFEFYLVMGSYLRNELLKNDKLMAGLNVCTRSADLYEISGTRLRFSEQFVGIPVFYGFDLTSGSGRKGIKHKLDIRIGIQADFSCYEKLDIPDNIDQQGDSKFGRYIRYSAISEISYGTLIRNRLLHRLGLRFTNDLHTFTKLSGSHYELYPYYHSVSFFYAFGASNR